MHFETATGSNNPTSFPFRKDSKDKNNTWTYSNTFKWHVIYFLFRNDTKRFCMFSIIQVIFTHIAMIFSYQ